MPLVIQFSIVTLIFMAADRRYVLDPDAWDPRTVSPIGSDMDVSTLDGLADQLIGPTSAKVVRITTSVLEFGFLVVALTVWLAISQPTSVEFMEPGPGWTDVWLATTVLFVISVINPLVTLVRPSWTQFRVAAKAFVDLGLVVILLWSLALGHWLVLADATTATADQLRVLDLLNGIIRGLDRDHHRLHGGVRGTGGAPVLPAAREGDGRTGRLAGLSPRGVQERTRRGGEQGRHADVVVRQARQDR